MLLRCALLMVLLSQPARACDQAVCRVDPDRLSLTRVVTFDGIGSGMGPGREVKGVLVLPGVQLGERFAGQGLFADGDFDVITGPGTAPLTVVPGGDGQNLSIVSMSGNPVVNGYGPAGFPRRGAQGEGAVAVLFDQDQSSLAFDLRGGESGSATILFLRRDGELLARVPIQQVGEFTLGFLRRDSIRDIAGFVVMNKDPQGLAIDTIRFGRPPGLS